MYTRHHATASTHHTLLTIEDASGLALTSMGLGVVALGSLSVLIHMRNRRINAFAISGRTSLTLAIIVTAHAVVALTSVVTGSFNL